MVLRAISCGIAALALACEAPPDQLEAYPPCMQPADVAPLDEQLVAFLPTFNGGDPIENADRLIAEGTVSLARRDPAKLPADPDWREDPFGDPTWVFAYQSLLFIQDALVAYRQTGEERYLDVAELHIGRWLADHLEPTFRASWGDHIMANRTRVLLLAWELLRRRDPASRIVDDTCRMLAVHADHLQRESEYTRNSNHGYFQDEALLSLSIAFPDDPRSPRWSEVARERMADQIEYAVSPEGVHREHSPSYHAGLQLVFANVARILEHFGLETRLDVAAIVESMWDYSAYGALPTGEAPLVGDSSRWFGTPNGDATETARYSLSQGTLGVAPAEVDRVFPKSGYAFFRDQWHPAETFADTVYVAFVAAYFSKVHKHCDDLSVMLHGRGEAWLVDIGFWSYDPDDHWAELSKSPAGHNVVEVDGRSYYGNLPEQDPLEAPAQITGYELGAETSWVAGEHRFNPGVTYRRRVDYTRPAHLFVRDELIARDGETHRYTLHWHLAPDKQVEALGPTRFRATNPERPAVSLEIDIAASGEVACEILVGAEDPYQGWFFPAFLESLPAPVIACTQHGRDASFTSTIDIASAE